jgi:hypothetical protein
MNMDPQCGVAVGSAATNAGIDGSKHHLDV